jgi:hypothetical protein
MLECFGHVSLPKLLIAIFPKYLHNHPNFGVAKISDSTVSFQVGSSLYSYPALASMTPAEVLTKSSMRTQTV